MACLLKSISFKGPFVVVIRGSFASPPLAFCNIVPTNHTDPAPLEYAFEASPYVLELSIQDLSGRAVHINIENDNLTLVVSGSIEGGRITKKMEATRTFNVIISDDGKTLTLSTDDGQPVGDNLPSSVDYTIIGL